MYTSKKIVSKKEFKKLRGKNTIIKGDTSLKKYNPKKHSRYDYVTYEDNMYVVKPNIKGITTKYLEVGTNTYIAIKAVINPIVYLILLAAIISIGIYLVDDIIPNRKDDVDIVGEDIEDYIENLGDDAYIDSIAIPGLNTVYNLSSKNKHIYLINPNKNTVFFTYTIKLDGKEIYKTGDIMPNKMVKANLYDILDAGSYEIEVILTSKDITTLKQCSKANLNTKIIVTK